MNELLIWFGILVCVSQSAIFSGLNLAFFSITRMRLNIEVSKGNKDAVKVLAMREDANFLLTTILWGNVGINVLLTLLSNSVMVGSVAFLFSTVVITLFGEITPQAYFSRHALKMASTFSFLLRFYQIILWPLAKPSAKILDMWLGREAVQFFKESEIEHIIQMHMEENSSEITNFEGKGALNFLALDDLKVTQEGEIIHPDSVIVLDFNGTKALFPDIKPLLTDPFLNKVQKSNKSCVIITDPRGNPRLVIDADGFIRAALFDYESFDPMNFSHRPIIISSEDSKLGDIISSLHVDAEHNEDDVIDKDTILIWGREHRIITGADILGRLLRGITIK